MVPILSYAQHYKKYYTVQFEGAAAAYGLNQLEIDILLFLHNNPELCTASDICRYRALAKSNVSAAVERLRSRGVLTVSPAPGNRRQRLLSFTDEGCTMAAALVEPVSKLIEEAQLSKALEEIFKVVSRANKYIDETAPWVLAKSEENMPRLAAVLYNLLESIRICSGLLFPFMPKTMPKVWEQIGADESMTAYDTLGTFGVLPQNVTVHKGEVLFPRIDMEKEIDELNSLLTPAKTIREDEDLDKANVITIDQFAEVKLRSGEITACEKIKKAKKLLKLFLTQMDRTILDSFSHANIGPRDTKAGRLLLACTG